jgi:hypothetical protein
LRIHCQSSLIFKPFRAAAPAEYAQAAPKSIAKAPCFHTVLFFEPEHFRVLAPS